jgi:hypothetical protein
VSQSDFIYQVSQENIFVHCVDTFCAFGLLSVPVCKLEMEHSTVTESDELRDLSMANENAMREMETSEVFSVLKMAFIRFTSS